MHENLAQENRFLSIDELSSLLHAKKMSIYRWTSQKTIPHLRMGRRLLFERSEIEKWLETKRVAK